MWILFAVLLQQEIPQLLEPWKEWVLHGHEARTCTALYNDAATTRCAWPSRLKLEIGEKSGSFRQTWVLELPGIVPLPGQPGVWPKNVRLNGKPHPVVRSGEGPAVFLEPGEHELNGHWQWIRRPDRLAIPAETGLLDLSVDGRPIPLPLRQGSWLQMEARNRNSQVSDALRLRVFRLQADGIPFTQILRLEMEVSGSGREILLGKPFGEEFQPMHLKSELPAKLDADGTLRLQVRSGHWTLEMRAHAKDIPHRLQVPSPGEAWPETEIWAFAPNHSIRQVALSGLVPIDPGQNDVPAQWATFSCYRAQPGHNLHLEERGRGANLEANHNLSLSRNLWLRHDGSGWSFQDVLIGSMSRSWRLEMMEPFLPGQILINQKPQLINFSASQSRPGVEIRNRDLTLQAEGRINEPYHRLPASGWQVPVEDATTDLHLPPGWRILAITGADRVTGDWLHSWKLWNFFLVLLVGATVSKLWNRKAGLLALTCLVLLQDEPDPPMISLISLLVAIALCRALPSGKLRNLGLVWRWGSFTILVVQVLFFSYGQLRFALYPQLSPPNYRMPSAALMAMEKRAPDQFDVTEEEMAVVMQDEAPAKQKLYKKRYVPEQEKEAKIQTGPGIPNWSGINPTHRYLGYSANFSWNGPVDPAQQISLTLIPPWLARILALLRVALLLLLTALCLDRQKNQPTNAPPAQRRVTAVAILLLAFFSAQAQDFPSPQMQEELRNRLLEPAQCFPACAQIEEASFRMRSEDMLSGQIIIHVAEPVAVPLPGLPSQALLEGRPLSALSLDDQGILWTALPQGIHKIELSYNLGQEEGFALNFPLQPHEVQVHAPGWTVSGVNNDGSAAGQILFRRERPTDNTSFQATTGALAPFVQVTRTLYFYNQWYVETTVTNQGDMPFLGQVDLLTDESVITPGIPVAKGKVRVALEGQGQSLFWRSNMPTKSSLTLTAPDRKDLVEHWRAFAETRWRMTWTGSPTILYFDDQGELFPSWQPRSGETLELNLVELAALKGQTLTITSSELSIKAGLRVSQCQLELDMRSSLGGEHRITLPDRAEPDRLIINGQDEPLRREGTDCLIPIKPGKQKIQLSWRINQPLGFFFQPPMPNLNHPAMNNRIIVNMASSRWLLWVNGPIIGPAVMFWSILLVIVLAAFALAKLTHLPLRFHSWLLLGLGLSQLHILSGICVVAWFLALGWRKKTEPSDCNPWLFNLIQLALPFLGFIVFIILLVAVYTGLLGQPNMYVEGFGSRATYLRWYGETSADLLPSVSVISLPAIVFKVIMLAWSLWLANACVKWAVWAWQCFSYQGFWHHIPRYSKKTKSDPPPSA